MGSGFSRYRSAKFHLSLNISTLRLNIFLNYTSPTEITTLSLHDALPIWAKLGISIILMADDAGTREMAEEVGRSEEHTSELQSRLHLVCRLLLEKKNVSLLMM